MKDASGWDSKKYVKDNHDSKSDGEIVFKFAFSPMQISSIAFNVEYVPEVTIALRFEEDNGEVLS